VSDVTTLLFTQVPNIDYADADLMVTFIQLPHLIQRSDGCSVFLCLDAVPEPQLCLLTDAVRRNVTLFTSAL